MRSQSGLHTGVVGVVAALALCLSGAVANAQQVTTEKQTATAAPPAAPSSTTVVQAPAAAPAPVAQTAPSSSTNKTVVTEQKESGSYMGTIAKDTLFGAVAGTLVGAAIYYIDRDNIEARSIAYWASGGALVGAAVGIVEVTTRESRQERAVSQVLNNGKTDVAFMGRVLDVRF